MKQILLLVGIVCVAATAFCQQLKQVTLTGNLINATEGTPKVLRVNFLNPFQKSSPSIRLNPDEIFLIRQEMLFTQNITIQYNKTFINLYVTPGDSVHLTINAALLNQPDFTWLTISGDHALINTQLNKCHSYLNHLPVKEYNYSVSVPTMLTAVKADYNRYVTALHSYAEKHQLDPLVVNFFKRDIIYVISNWISDYVKLGSDETSSMAERAKMFNDPIFDIHNPSNFQSMMFPYHLDSYALSLIETDSSIQEAKKAGRIKDAIRKAALLLSNETANSTRDYMLYSYISRSVIKTPALLDELPELKSYFTNPVYYNYLKNTASLNNEMTFPPLLLNKVTYLTTNGDIRSLSSGDLLTYLTKQHPGKVLYIDVYATWCGPCLAEMKFTPELHNEFNNKNIVFINLCLQSDLGKWKNLVKQANMGGENYFLDDDASKLFLSNYRLNGFPSYMLLNTKGKIVSTLAPRPSESVTLRNILTGLVN